MLSRLDGSAPGKSEALRDQLALLPGVVDTEENPESKGDPMKVDLRPSDVAGQRALQPELLASPRTTSLARGSASRSKSSLRPSKWYIGSCAVHFSIH